MTVFEPLGRVAPRAPIWPLFLAPLIAGVYYLALRAGFSYSLGSVVSDASDVSPRIPGGPTWGTHWLYRSFAEAVSIPFAIFVAAGIARERAKIAGLVGGLSISVVYLLRNLFAVYLLFYLKSEDWSLTEPWYHHVIVEGLIIVGAPLIALTIGEAAKESACSKAEGFAGINRLHFFWLWLAVLAYSSGIISPLLHYWIEDLLSFGFGGLVRTIVFGLPVLTYAIPLFWGISVLAHDSNWSRRTDNILGPVILIVGWLLATGITLVWALLLHAVFG